MVRVGPLKRGEERLGLRRMGGGKGTMCRKSAQRWGLKKVLSGGTTKEKGQNCDHLPSSTGARITREGRPKRQWGEGIQKIVSAVERVKEFGT